MIEDILQHPPRRTKDQIVSMLTCHPEVTYEEIGDLVGLSRQRVQQIAHEVGLKRNKTARHHRGDITTERVLELYHGNLLVKDIAQILGCAKRTVRRRLRVAGVSKNECYSRSMKLSRRGRSLAQSPKGVREASSL